MTAASRRFVIVLACASGALFVGLAILSWSGGVFGFDHVVQDLVQRTRHRALDRPMRELSDLGSGWDLVPLNILTFFMLSLRSRKLAVLLPGMTLGATALEALGKWVVGRPRPKLVGYGFPSGHVLVAMAFFGGLVYILWKLETDPLCRRAAATCCAVLVMGIAYSRLYLNAHWASDILGAFAGGLAYLLFVIILVEPAPPPRGPSALLASADPSFGA